ncbi:portal protein [Oceanospirillaceae bacterium ASx5O]|nr:portal protein [Oceanospirillaceae bacterium ASx5O]
MSEREHLTGVKRLHKILEEVDYQPEWRGEADRCFQYYDGNQLEPALIETLRRRSMPILTTNLVAPTINGVLGMEARSRTDWFVQADDDEFAEVAEGLNLRLNEAMRIAKANRATSDAYKAQVIGGIGWVEVKRNKDPLGPKYRIHEIHRDEISWDWKASTDLSDCRWMLRERWVDKDELEAAFPKHKDIIKHSIGQWADFDTREFMPKGDLLSRAYDEYQYSTRNETEWLLPHRDMVKVYELYYRVWEQGIIIKDERGNAAQFDENNKFHIALINTGKVQIEKRSIPKLRLSWHIGPHHVHDGPSPHPHNHYPYVPFFGVQEDKTKRPYGLVRAMLSPQDEINFRRIKLTGDLNYKRIIMDDDASNMSDEQLQDEIHRSDGIVKLNPSARRKGGGLFRVETDQGIAQQQFQVMQDAKTLIQDVAGVYNAFLGKEGGAKSGVAINSLVEQGATTLADINDNYRFARQMLGELVLAYEVTELKEQRNVSIFIPQQPGQKAKEVVLNEETGTGEISNAVAQAKTQVVLGDIQQSPGYRAQMAEMLLDFIGKMPQEVQIGAMDMVIEQLDLPTDKKARLLKALQKATGEVNTDDMSEEEQQAYQQEQQAAQQKQQMAEESQMAAMQLQLEELKAKIQKMAADADLTTQKAGTEKVKQTQMAMDMARNSRVPPPPPHMVPMQ